MSWTALAEAVIRRRVELGYPTRGAFIAASGISARTLGDIETARGIGYARSTLARLEQALRWPVGYISGILEPSQAEAPASVGDRVMPPTAVKVAWLLGDDSPLPERDRRTLEATLNKVLEAFWPPPADDR